MVDKNNRQAFKPLERCGEEEGREGEEHLTNKISTLPTIIIMKERKRERKHTFVCSQRFDVGNGKSRVQSLRAHLGAIENGVALVDLEVVGVQFLKTLLTFGITRISDPSS